MNFSDLCQELETKIQDSYINGVTLDEAEKLAGMFLYAQLQVSTELKKADLDARMRKSGLKAIRSAAYIDIVSKNEKKPTEAGIAAMIDTDDVVDGEQRAFDTAEVNRDELERLYDVFTNAHVHFRTISKGRFE